MAEEKKSSHRSRIRPPLGLVRYTRRLGIWNFFFWFLILWWSSGVAFYWINKDGLVDHATTFGSTVWTAFFVGFIVFCSSTTQSRRILFIGRLEPTPAEWAQLEKVPARPLSFGFWGPALLFALLLALSLGGLQLLLGYLGDFPGYPRRSYQFYTLLLPAVAAAFTSCFVARWSVRRFVAAAERAEPLRLPRRRYLVLHNVLPYALFNAAVGLVPAFARFGNDYLNHLDIPVHALALHLAVTTFFIALFVAGAASFKTKVDFLSPIVLTGPKPASRRMRWRFWYALVLPLLVYPLLRLIFWVLGISEMGTTSAIIVKVAVCLTIAFSTSIWAVTSVLYEMEQKGLEHHPYVRIFRFLREAGYLDRADKNPPMLT